MSDKLFEENFWSKIEKDGGFNLGEMTVFMGRSLVGKSTFDYECLLDVRRDDTNPNAPPTTKVLKQRDYNGPQSEFDFTSDEILPND